MKLTGLPPVYCKKYIIVNLSPVFPWTVSSYNSLKRKNLRNFRIAKLERKMIAVSQIIYRMPSADYQFRDKPGETP